MSKLKKQTEKPKRGRPPKGKKLKNFRPEKPFKDFPLTPISTGMWVKRIKGKLHYFGKWGERKDGELVRLPNDGWEDALALYNAQKNDLLKGGIRKAKAAEMTIAALCNEYLTCQEVQLKLKNIRPKTFQRNRKIAEYVAEFLGRTTLVEDLRPSDFQKLLLDISAGRCNTSIRCIMRWVTAIFNYGVEDGHLDRPVVFGKSWKAPKVDKQSNVENLLTADELHKMLEIANPKTKAMVLLALNTGFENISIATLPISALDLDKRWVTYPRPKTGESRRNPLWPETVEALKEVLANRPEPADKAYANLVFLTRTGRPFLHDPRSGKTTATDLVHANFKRLLKQIDLGERKRIGFYTLRRLFASVALQAKDRDAVIALMGHKFRDQTATYDQIGPSDERRITVSNFVRTWFLAGEPKPNKKGGAK